MTLKAYGYNFKEEGENAPKSYGFMAQEVYKVFPELTANWNGTLAVNYQGFIPFITTGLQDLNARTSLLEKKVSFNFKEVFDKLKAKNEVLTEKVEVLQQENQQIKETNKQVVEKNREQEKRLAEMEQKSQEQENRLEEMGYSLEQLQQMMATICNMPCLQNGKPTSGQGYGSGNNDGRLENTDQPRLSQNQPNPFNQETQIEYYLPENSGNAQIVVKSTEGKIVGEYTITQTGTGFITIAAGILAPANYFYNLMIG